MKQVGIMIMQEELERATKKALQTISRTIPVSTLNN
jgi:hypothetical protein